MLEQPTVPYIEDLARPESRVVVSADELVGLPLPAIVRAPAPEVAMQLDAAAPEPPVDPVRPPAGVLGKLRAAHDKVLA